jgi:NDP-sugar pyrophosphorylase family protein
VDDKNTLVGTITDGDTRRFLISNLDLGASAREFCNKNPNYVTENFDMDAIKSVMRRLGIALVPKVDEERKVKSILILKSSIKTKLPVTGLLVAGGKGTRLGRLTREIPKPMVRVNGKPVIESLVDNLETQGINDVLIAVRHQADQIVGHFENRISGKSSIRFIKEDEPLDSLGSLNLLPREIEDFLLVMHADLVHEIDLRLFIKRFIDSNAHVSIITKEIDYELPYGQITYINGNNLEIVEKPVIKIEVYVGILALKKEIISYLPKGPLNILDLLKLARDSGLKVTPFKTCDYWRDIGNEQEFQRVQAENNFL